MAKSITGVVASKKTDKTIVVTENVRLTHPLYRKQYTVSRRYMAHDENNEAGEGDKVIIVETRPLSARKRFRLEKVVEKAGVKHVETEDVLPAVTEKTEAPVASPTTKASASKKSAEAAAEGEEK